MPGSRILVVDDNRSIAETVCTLVRLLGHECACAYGGQAAIDMVAEYRPDVVMLDLKMPDPDGFAVARSLRQAGFEAKIVAMTGFGESVFDEKPADAGFDAVLTKPATAEEIAAILS